MKKTILALASAAAIAATTLITPTIADARPSYGRGDICAQARHRAANRGTVAGAVLGGIIGNQVAGHGARTEGTLIGAGVGAVAGHQIGRSSVRCTSYPRSLHARGGCRWVVDSRGRDFEVCRSRDGNWYRSGRG